MNKSAEDLERIKSLSTLMDAKFRGPFGTTFGLDGLIGLIPGIGDMITSAVSVYIVATAAAMGVSSATLIRMAMNIAIDNIFDLIPFAGNFFDFYWKANLKNLKLLEEHLDNPARETIRSRIVVGLLAVLLLAVLILSAWVSFRIIATLLTWVTNYIS